MKTVKLISMPNAEYAPRWVTVGEVYPVVGYIGTNGIIIKGEKDNYIVLTSQTAVL